MSEGKVPAFALPRMPRGKFTFNRLKFGLLLGFASLLGAGILFVILLRWPGSYIEISNQLAWRLQWPSILQNQLEQTLYKLQLRGDALVRSGDILLFGDSHLQALPGSSLPNSVNYAIGGESASNLAKRIAKYPSLLRVKQLIVLTGRNDLARNENISDIATSFVRLLEQVPMGVTVAMVGIPPATENIHQVAHRKLVNQNLERLCAKRPNCKFVDLESMADQHGRLKTEFDSGDGVHLNESGYRLLLTKLDETGK